MSVELPEVGLGPGFLVGIANIEEPRPLSLRGERHLAAGDSLLDSGEHFWVTQGSHAERHEIVRCRPPLKREFNKERNELLSMSGVRSYEFEDSEKVRFLLGGVDELFIGAIHVVNESPELRVDVCQASRRITDQRSAASPRYRVRARVQRPPRNRTSRPIRSPKGGGSRAAKPETGLNTGSSVCSVLLCGVGATFARLANRESQ